MAIDIGSAVIDRGGYYDAGATRIVKENPANASGRITSVDIWAEATIMSAIIATFYRPDPSGHPNNFTARDSQLIGEIVLGAKRTFEVDLKVESGDYIGMYWRYAGDHVERDTSGDGMWFKLDDQVSCENTEFTFNADNTMSLGASGFESISPTITTQSATSIKNVYCTGNGNVTHEGYADIIERGFEYGYTEVATWSVKETGTDLGSGAYTLTLTGLSPETTYHYRAYAKNSIGTGYGDWVEFTTSATAGAVEYGMHEEDNSPTICFYVRKVGGKWSKKFGPYTEDQSNIEITKILTEGTGEYQIKFESDVLTGISAGIMCKLDIKAR